MVIGGIGPTANQDGKFTGVTVAIANTHVFIVIVIFFFLFLLHSPRTG